MKTITLEVNEDVAEKLLAMDSNKRSLYLKFVIDLIENKDRGNRFIKTVEQTEMQGLNESNKERRDIK